MSNCSLTDQKYLSPSLRPLAYAYINFFISSHTFLLLHSQEEGGEDETNDEENDETIEEDSEMEHVPRLFSLCSEDVAGRQEVLMPQAPVWSTKIVHNPNPRHSVVVMKSNIWPGAIALAAGCGSTDVVYFGWGTKAAALHYEPPMPPEMQDEYPTGPEIFEINDPSLLEENEYRKKYEQSLGAASEDEDVSEEMDDEDMDK